MLDIIFSVWADIFAEEIMPTAVEKPGWTALASLLAELEDQGFGQNIKALMSTLPTDQHLGEVLSQDVLDLVPAVQDSSTLLGGNLQGFAPSTPAVEPGAVADLVLELVPPAIPGLEPGKPAEPPSPPEVTPPTDDPPGSAISSQVLTMVGAHDLGASELASNHGSLQLGGTNLPETPSNPVGHGAVADLVLELVPPAIIGLEPGHPTETPAGPPEVTPPTAPPGAAISSEVLAMIGVPDVGASAFVHTGLTPEAHGPA